MALNDPTEEKASLAGPFLVVFRKMTRTDNITIINIARASVFAVLLALPTAAAFAQRAPRLDDRDPDLRSKAAEEAGREGDTGAAAILKRLPEEKNPAVTVQLLHSLGSTGDQAAVKSLADQASAGADAVIRAEACMSLSDFPKSKEAEAALRAALLRDGEDDGVRISAAYSLMIAFRQSKAAQAAIETALKKGDKPLKGGIIDNLRHISGTPEGRRLLEAAYQDKDPELKGAAGKIIYGVDVKEGRNSKRR